MYPEQSGPEYSGRHSQRPVSRLLKAVSTQTVQSSRLGPVQLLGQMGLHMPT